MAVAEPGDSVYGVQGGMQLSLYQLDDPLLTSLRDELKGLDLNSMSPLDAFDEIRKLQKEIGIGGKK